MAISYEGKRVIVTGGGGAGMGAAAVRQLVDARRRGACPRHARSRRPRSPVTAPSISPIPRRWRSPSRRSADRSTALFNCVGVRGAAVRHATIFTMLVNFVGVRHLTELVAERMPRRWSDRDDHFSARRSAGRTSSTRGCHCSRPTASTRHAPGAKSTPTRSRRATSPPRRSRRPGPCTPATISAPAESGSTARCPVRPRRRCSPSSRRRSETDFWAQYPIPLGRFATPDDQALRARLPQQRRGLVHHRVESSLRRRQPRRRCDRAGSTARRAQEQAAERRVRVPRWRSSTPSCTSRPCLWSGMGSRGQQDTVS